YRHRHLMFESSGELMRKCKDQWKETVRIPEEAISIARRRSYEDLRSAVKDLQDWRTTKEGKQVRQAFWRAYWGTALYYESKRVEHATALLGNVVNDWYESENGLQALSDERKAQFDKRIAAVLEELKNEKRND